MISRVTGRCRRRWPPMSNASSARSSTSWPASPGNGSGHHDRRERQAGRHVPQRAGADPRDAAAAQPADLHDVPAPEGRQPRLSAAGRAQPQDQRTQRLPRRERLQLRSQPVHPGRPDAAAGQDGSRLRLPALPGFGRGRAARRLLPELRRAARRGGPAQVRALRARLPPGAGTGDAVATGRHRRRALRSPAAGSTASAAAAIASPEPVPALTAAPAPAFPPGFYADPDGRCEARWWDGSQWTAQVIINGQPGVDTGPPAQSLHGAQ